DGHCGTCGNTCANKFEHGTGVCGGTADSPVCVIESCDEGFVAINAFQCIVPPNTTCQPCASDDVCFGGACVTLDGLDVCAAPCAVDEDCGEGFECTNQGAQQLCLPVTGSC
ncbi:MAG: hypothetical protein QF464_13640, partial [Myxococcota bacterium]|nr:hypothetical protein [Myxococcota bacterium]